MSAPADMRNRRINQAKEALQKHRREVHNHNSLVCETGAMRQHAVEVTQAICWHFIHCKKDGKRDSAFRGLAAAMDAMCEHHLGCGCPESAPEMSFGAEKIVRHQYSHS